MPYEQNLVLFEALKHERSWTLEAYRKFGGYQAWEKILREQTPREKIIEDVKASGLRGRGGRTLRSSIITGPGLALSHATHCSTMRFD